MSNELWLVGRFYQPLSDRSCALDEVNTGLATLVVWSSLTARPRIQDLNDLAERKGMASPRATFTLDPSGRYVIQELSWRAGTALRTHDVNTDQPGPLGWAVNDNARSYYSLQYSRWLKGKYPIWKSIESSDGTAAHQRVWRLHTAPGARELTVTELEDTPLPAASKVLDDGKTVVAEPTSGDLGPVAEPSTDAAAIEAATDPSHRFLGTGKNSLRRLADGEELFFEEYGGYRTARGVFDGPIDVVSRLVFRIGDDPGQGAVVHGDQVAALFYHPQLVDDFFAGKPLVPALLGSSLGLPPRLSALAAPELQAGGGMVFHVKAADGGSGVSILRRWVDGRPVGVPVPITAGQPTDIAVPLSSTACSSVRLYACNQLGYVCSPALTHDFCPPGVQPPDMASRWW